MARILTKTLEGLNLYKVNKEYMKPIDDKLSSIESGLREVGDVAGCGHQILLASKTGDTALAIDAALRYFEIDDEVKELQDIKKKIEKGQTLETAIAAAPVQALYGEIVKTTTDELTASYNDVTGLLEDITSLSKEIAEKLTKFRFEAASWPIPVKLGTAAALRETFQETKKVNSAASNTRKKIEELKQSILEINF